LAESAAERSNKGVRTSDKKTAIITGASQDIGAGWSSVVSVTAALADQPIAGIDGSVPMITKGCLNSVIRSLAIEYAKEGIRFNAVAPGVVDTPMHTDDPKDFLKTLQPMGKIADVADVVDAVLYLAQAPQVSGEVLHVDGGAHAGRW
jgi:NAD(P)-dependent dehydrogenase (short-subunit alcohol dehydrogenase family)